MDTLTILYTAHIGGDLALLPRLYTYMQQIKRDHAPDALLLDLGHACAEGIWHCDATAGRSTVIVLDGMGYHAVNVAAYLTEAQRAALQHHVSVGLVDARFTWRYHVPPVQDETIVVSAVSVPALTLSIVAAPAERTALDERTLHLASVAKGEIGLVRVDMASFAIHDQQTFTLPAVTLPDATIAAAVELVEDEARRASRR